MKRISLDYKSKLGSVGFNVHADEYVKKFTKQEVYRFGFDLNELIFFCKK